MYFNETEFSLFILLNLFRLFEIVSRDFEAVGVVIKPCEIEFKPASFPLLTTN